MLKKPTPLTEDQKCQVMREMGRRGGGQKTDKPKGLAKATPAERLRIAMLGVAARRKKAT